MDTMNINDTIDTEAIEAVAESVPAGKGGMKSVVKGGIVIACGVAAWEFVVKPVGRKIKTALKNRKANRKPDKNKTEEVDLEDMEIDDIPEIDE